MKKLSINQVTRMQDDPKLYASGGVSLLGGQAFKELRDNAALADLVGAMREHEARFAKQLSDVDAASVRLWCQREIVALLESRALEEVSDSDDPSAFAHAVRSLRGAPSMARKRRYAREVANIYKHACGVGLFVPRRLDDYHRLWDLAMECEPRWSEGYPSSVFRTRQSEVRSSREEEGILQVNARPECIATELSELLDFLSNEEVLQEVRAIASYASMEFTHPFVDGNGHVGRMLLVASLADRYSLPTIVRFSCLLATNKQLGRLLIPLRKGERSIADFCLEVLVWLYGVQPEMPLDASSAS